MPTNDAPPDESSRSRAPVDPVTLDDITPPPADAPPVDELEREGERNLDSAAEALRNDLVLQQVKDIEHYRELREKYAGRVFRFLLAWSALVLAAVFLQGWKVCGFQLDVAVMSTLLGGTTISVLGLVGFIVKGLFPDRKG